MRKILDGTAPPEPAIDAETRLRAERLVLVAMESAGVAPRAAWPRYDTRILGKGPNLSGLEPPFARAAFGATSLERLTPTSATLPIRTNDAIERLSAEIRRPPASSAHSPTERQP